MTSAGTRATRSAPGSAGLALAVLSAATFGTSGAFASALIDAGWSPAAAVLARLVTAALMLTIPAMIQLRGRWALLRRNLGKVAAYGLIAVAGCQFFYFNAIARMPVGVALLLEYLAVVLVVGWLWLRHGQRHRTDTHGSPGHDDRRQRILIGGREHEVGRQAYRGQKSPHHAERIDMG